MEFQYSKSMASADQSCRAVLTERQIRYLRRAVTPDAITANTFDAEVQLFREQGHSEARSHAATGAGIVERADRTRCERTINGARDLHERGRWLDGIAGIRSHHAARIYPVAERADDAE